MIAEPETKPKRPGKAVTKLKQDREISASVRRAIKSGHIPTLRNWRKHPEELEHMTQGERVCYFVETFLHVPEGDLVGQRIKLLEFQEVFILAIFDGPKRARRAILTLGRKNGKTAVIASLMLAFMFMRDLVKPNSRTNSGALSRDQAALLFGYMAKCLQLSPALEGKYRVVPSGKQITSLTTGIEFTALAAEANRAMGLSPVVACLDEIGQIAAPTSDFVDAILSAQGAHSNPLAVIISTQAPSDSSVLSVMIDDAERNPSPDVVCHAYYADKELEITDPVGWEQANPAMGVFRSIDDIRLQAERAARLPDASSSFENLILNRRVALSNLWLSPSVWKANAGEPDWEIFREYGVHLGLDLSVRNDLTAAVLAMKDPATGRVHIAPLCFTPEIGIAERELRDKTPYQSWVKRGLLTAVPGATLDYSWLAGWLKAYLDEKQIPLLSIQFDRWRIAEFRRAATDVGFAIEAEWVEVGQGYQSFSPRIEALETLLLQQNVHHGAHPLLNMAAAGAIVVRDPAGNRKLDKSKASTKIDPIVAAVMAVYPLVSTEAASDLSTWIF